MLNPLLLLPKFETGLLFVYIITRASCFWPFFKFLIFLTCIFFDIIVTERNSHWNSHQKNFFSDDIFDDTLLVCIFRHPRNSWFFLIYYECIFKWFLVVVSTTTCAHGLCLVCVQGSHLTLLGGHMEYWRLNLDWLHSRIVSYPLYYLFGWAVQF